MSAQTSSSEGVTTDDGVKIYYTIQGEGDEILLVSAASQWAEDLTPLTQKRRMIFFDQRGRGR